jgi:hypothetical protein
MGIFNMFKKKDVEPIPPPIPNETQVRGPVEFPDDNSFNDDPFSNIDNDSNNFNQESKEVNSLNEMPEPPRFHDPEQLNNVPDQFNNDLDPFENFSNKTNEQELSSQPFNANVPNFPDLNQENLSKNVFQNDLPNPFDLEGVENNNVGKRMPTFAEKFGLNSLNQNTPINIKSEKNLEIKNDENIQEDSNEINETNKLEKINSSNLSNLPSLDDPIDEDSEPFSFSIKDTLSKPISRIELPLDEEDNVVEKKIDEHVDEVKNNFNQKDLKSQSKNLDNDLNDVLNDELDHDLEETKNLFVEKPVKNKFSIHKKGSSIFISLEACSDINGKLSNIKNSLDNCNNVYNKYLEIEKKPENELLSWKKNIENLQSLLFSIDKKLFR